MQKHTCEYGKVWGDDDIVCSRTMLGDSRVSPNLCRECPARACNWEHLRFSVENPSLFPIVIRWVNGHSQTWNNQSADVSLIRSPCEAKAIRISSPRDCVGCALRPFDFALFDPSATLRTSRAPFDRAQGRQGRPLHDPEQEECTVIEGPPITQGPGLWLTVRDKLRLRRSSIITQRAIFVIGLAFMVRLRLSEQARAAVRAICGAMASMPMSMLILVELQKLSEKEERERYPARPPVVIVNPQSSQGSRLSSGLCLALPSEDRTSRDFKIIGHEGWMGAEDGERR